MLAASGDFGAAVTSKEPVKNPAVFPGRASGLEILRVSIPDDGQDEAVVEQRLQGAQD